jgi:YHS domain-containing protein
MKHTLTVLALCTFVALAGSGAVTGVPSDRIGGDLKGSHPGYMRVWVEKGTRKVNVDSNGVILKGYDAVAYFTQDKAVKGSPQYQTTYEGATYHFSSAANLAAFKKDPSKYAPQYGGYCANGMKDSKLKDCDPTVFSIQKGKLYVYEHPAAKKEFHARSLEHVIKADHNWYQMFE